MFRVSGHHQAVDHRSLLRRLGGEDALRPWPEVSSSQPQSGQLAGRVLCPCHASCQLCLVPLVTSQARAHPHSSGSTVQEVVTLEPPCPQSATSAKCQAPSGDEQDSPLPRRSCLRGCVAQGRGHVCGNVVSGLRAGSEVELGELVVRRSDVAGTQLSGGVLARLP